jgi:hypothetical protein
MSQVCTASVVQHSLVDCMVFLKDVSTGANFVRVVDGQQPSMLSCDDSFSTAGDDKKWVYSECLRAVSRSVD